MDFTTILVRKAEPQDREEWLRMRAALWPDCSPDRHLAEIAAFSVAGPRKDPPGRVPEAAFVAVRSDGGLGGLLEASIRPLADGCDTRPVGYIEGWYVDPDLRRRGIGRRLAQAAEDWARSHGCQEMASDCTLDNDLSLRAHLALGYEETERLVHFRKAL
jgi:aminoglycoside 6'-N-acetyltransferase I